jgi:hypothetical protein
VTDAEFSGPVARGAFIAQRFADREVIFAAATDLTVTAKSDGIFAARGTAGLLAAAVAWYRQLRAQEAVASGDAATLLRDAQAALASTGKPA